MILLTRCPIVLGFCVVLGCTSEQFVAWSPTTPVDSSKCSKVNLSVDGQPTIDSKLVLHAGSKTQFTYTLTFSMAPTPDEVMRFKTVPCVHLSLQAGTDKMSEVARGVPLFVSAQSENEFTFSCPLSIPNGKGTLLVEASFVEVEPATSDGVSGFRTTGIVPFHRIECSIQ
jgi:hypothetical protein